MTSVFPYLFNLLMHSDVVSYSAECHSSQSRWDKYLISVRYFRKAEALIVKGRRILLAIASEFSFLQRWLFFRRRYSAFCPSSEAVSRDVCEPIKSAGLKACGVILLRGSECLSPNMEDVVGKYVSQKISKTRWRPVSATVLQPPEIFATGSWDNEVTRTPAWPAFLLPQVFRLSSLTIFSTSSPQSPSVPSNCPARENLVRLLFSRWSLPEPWPWLPPSCWEFNPEANPY